MWIYCCVYRPKDFPNMPNKLSSPWCVDVLAAIGCRVNIRIWRLMSVGMGISYKISTVKDKKCWEIDPFGVFILHNGIWNEWFQISEYCHVANLIISILLVWIKQIEQNRRNNIFFFLSQRKNWLIIPDVHGRSSGVRATSISDDWVLYYRSIGFDSFFFSA